VWPCAMSRGQPVGLRSSGLLAKTIGILVVGMTAAVAGCDTAGVNGDVSTVAPAGAEGTGVTGIRYLAGDSAGFARALTPRAFVFPQDHASHPGFRNEWWYFTGNVFDATGRHFGFELTFFRVALAAPRRERESAWASDQIWLGHLAVTDTAHREFHAEERLSRGALGLAGAEASPLHIWVEDWGVTEPERGVLRLVAEGRNFSIDLELRGLERIVAQGDGGLDRKGPEAGNASYYYSAPRLVAKGSIRVGDDAAVSVNGSAWMDREWSTSALSAGIVGWDWFALQLDDGRDLMYYRLRREDGGTSPFSGGSVADLEGVRRLGPDDVALEVTRRWRSRSSGVEYPVAWRMRIPTLGLDLGIEPYLEDQEVDLSVRYWEGAVRVRGSVGDGALAGSGYLELAGY